MGLRERLKGIQHYRVVRVNLNTLKSEVIVSKNDTVIDQSEIEMESGYRYSCVAVMKKGTKTVWSYSTTPVVTKEKTVKELPPLIQIDPEAKAYLENTMEGFSEVFNFLDEFRKMFVGEPAEGEEGGENQPPPQGQYPPQQSGETVMMVRNADGSLMPIPAPKFDEVAFPWYTHPYGLNMIDNIMEKAGGWASDMGEKFAKGFRKKMFSLDESETTESGDSASGKMLDDILGDE